MRPYRTIITFRKKASSQTAEDKEGNVTCIGHGKGLGGVLDLIMVKTEEGKDKPQWFQGPRIAAQEGSDHLPVIYRVKWGTQEKKS